MPKVVNADRDLAHSAISAFLSSIGIDYSTDNTLDADRNVISRYCYGSVNANSFAYFTYGKQTWLVETTGSTQYFGYCDSIEFYDEYDAEGNFLGRKVSISGRINVFYFSLPTDIVYSGDVGGFGFYTGRIILNDFGTPIWQNVGVVLAGGGFYNGDILATKKLRWANWDGFNDIDAYWGSLNDYEVVKIGDKYYFKVPGYDALFPGDGSEGTEVTPQIIEIAEEDATVYYLTGEELLEDAEIWYLLNIQVDMTKESVLEQPEVVDKTVAEAIAEAPQSFPNVGQAVLERSKRVITRLEFG